MNYYGVRYAKGCHPSDFWVTYFTSSKKVSEYRKIHGDPDVIEIRKTFTSDNKINESREFETKVLRRLQVHKRSDYLNVGINKGIPPMFGNDNPMNIPNVRNTHLNSINSPEHRKNKSIKSTELWKSASYRELQSSSRKEAWANNLTRKLEVSEQFRELWNNESYCEIQSAKRKELWKDPDYYAKMVVTRQGKRNGRFDPTLYIFEHIDGTVEVTTRYDLTLKYKLSRSSMCGVIKKFGTIHRGWSCVGLAKTHDS